MDINGVSSTELGLPGPMDGRESVKVTLIISGTAVDGDESNVLGEMDLISWKFSRIVALLDDHLGNISKNFINVLIGSCTVSNPWSRNGCCCSKKGREKGDRERHCLPKHCRGSKVSSPM